MNRRPFVGSLAAGVVGILSGCTSSSFGFGNQQRTENLTYDVESGTGLAIINRNGSVTVEGYDGDDIEADIEISGDSDEAVQSVSVTDSRTDGTLKLTTEYADSGDQPRPSVNYTVRCPEGAHVETARTSNGSVELSQVAGDATLRSENGSLTAENVDGTVSLRTSSGSITARDVGGLAGAKTLDGSIDLDVPSIWGDTEVKSTNGSIDAALASDLDAAVFAATTNGSVELHDVGLSSVDSSRTSVHGSLGDGSHDLKFETTNGDVDLRSLSD